MRKELTNALAEVLNESYPKYLSVPQIRDLVQRKLDISVDTDNLRKTVNGRLMTGLKNKSYVRLRRESKKNPQQTGKWIYRMATPPTEIATPSEAKEPAITSSILAIKNELSSLEKQSKILIKTLEAIQLSAADFPDLSHNIEEAHQRFWDKSIEVAGRINAYEAILSAAQQSSKI